MHYIQNVWKDYRTGKFPAFWRGFVTGVVRSSSVYVYMGRHSDTMWYIVLIAGWEFNPILISISVDIDLNYKYSQVSCKAVSMYLLLLILHVIVFPLSELLLYISCTCLHGKISIRKDASMKMKNFNYVKLETVRIIHILSCCGNFWLCAGCIAACMVVVRWLYSGCLVVV